MASIAQPGELIAHGLLQQLVLQILAGRHVAGHTDYRRFTVDSMLERADASFKDDDFFRPLGWQAQHIAGAELVLHHQHLLAVNRLADLLQKPAGLGGHQYVLQVLAYQ